MTSKPFADIAVCVFDAYGTLFDVHSAVQRGGEALGEKAGAVSALWRQKQLEYAWLSDIMGAHLDLVGDHDPRARLSPWPASASTIPISARACWICI